jgi:hypothetical protein
LTACSTPGSQACCILLPVLRFIAFGRPGLRLHSRVVPGLRAASPQCRTLQSVPLAGSLPRVTAVVALLPLPPSAVLRSRQGPLPDPGRPSSLRPWSTSGLCSISESVASPTVSSRSTPDALLGFVLLLLALRPPCGLGRRGLIGAMSTSKNDPRCLLG